MLKNNDANPAKNTVEALGNTANLLTMFLRGDCILNFDDHTHIIKANLLINYMMLLAKRILTPNLKKQLIHRLESETNIDDVVDDQTEDEINFSRGLYCLYYLKDNFTGVHNSAALLAIKRSLIRFHDRMQEDMICTSKEFEKAIEDKVGEAYRRAVRGHLGKIGKKTLNALKKLLCEMKPMVHQTSNEKKYGYDEYLFFINNPRTQLDLKNVLERVNEIAEINLRPQGSLFIQLTDGKSDVFTKRNLVEIIKEIEGRKSAAKLEA